MISAYYKAPGPYFSIQKRLCGLLERVNGYAPTRHKYIASRAPFRSPSICVFTPTFLIRKSIRIRGGNFARIETYAPITSAVITCNPEIRSGQKGSKGKIKRLAHLGRCYSRYIARRTGLFYRLLGRTVPQ